MHESIFPWKEANPYSKSPRARVRAVNTEECECGTTVTGSGAKSPRNFLNVLAKCSNPPSDICTPAMYAYQPALCQTRRYNTRVAVIRRRVCVQRGNNNTLRGPGCAITTWNVLEGSRLSGHE